MDSKHVLVVDSNVERSWNVLFLLKLAACQVTLKKDLSEAINWLRTCRSLQQQIDLLIINKAEIENNHFKIVSEIEQLSEETSILVIEKNISKAEKSNLNSCRSCKKNIHSCSPEKVGTEIYKILLNEFEIKKHDKTSLYKNKIKNRNFKLS